MGSAHAGLLCLILAGCGNVEKAPDVPPAESASAPPSASAAAQLPPATPWDEFLVEMKKRASGRDGKLALAGGGALLVTVVVGMGVVKLLRGAPARQEGRA